MGDPVKCTAWLYPGRHEDPENTLDASVVENVKKHAFRGGPSIRTVIGAHGIVLIVESGRPNYCFRITSADSEQNGGEYDGERKISTNSEGPGLP